MIARFTSVLMGGLQLAGLVIWAGPSQAALVCSAAIDPLILGQVSVRDGFSNPTFGAVQITCSGGAAGATIKTCLQIGAGSGGAAGGLSPRRLRGLDNSYLDYELTLLTSYSMGGQTVVALDANLALDASGNGSAAPLIYAQITALGATAPVGSYSSMFTGADGLVFSFGENGCDQTGQIAEMTVSANLTASCAVDVTAMDFGITNEQVSSQIDSRAQIFVSCTNNTPYSVGLDFGTHARDSTSTGRGMSNGTQTVHYGLFHTATRNDSWELTDGTLHDGLGSGYRQTIDIFGRVFGDQTLVSGQYTDSVVVVITY